MQTASTRALLTLILGIFSVLCCGFMTGIPSIILGMTELSAIKKGTAPVQGAGVTKIGLVLGSIGTIATLLILMTLILFIATMGTTSVTSMHMFHGLRQSI